MDVMEPGRCIGRDIGKGEAVEHELDAFISKRHEQRVAKEGERAKMPPNHKEYTDAENRIREGLALRGGVLPHHTYPGRREDLEAMREYHAQHGVPPAGFLARLWWRLGGKA